MSDHPGARRRQLIARLPALGLATLPVAAARLAQAQAGGYPSKPVRFVVAFPAGSATDQTARLVAQQITKVTGQSVVVDNRGGANGFIAAEAVAKAAPDGYTVLVTTGTTHAANPALFRKLPYDPVKDFTPVTPLSLGGFILVVAPGFAAQNVADLARLAKASPGKYSFASGNGPSRIGGEMFKMMSGADLLHVPYRGAPQALNDLMAGQVSMMWTDTRTGVPLVQAGKLKALAVTSRQRMSTLPQVPTMIEQGYPDYLLINWVGVYLPARATPELVTRLNSLLHAAVKAEMANLIANGGEALISSPEEFARLQASDTAMWARVVKAAGIEPE